MEGLNPATGTGRDKMVKKADIIYEQNPFLKPKNTKCQLFPSPISFLPVPAAALGANVLGNNIEQNCKHLQTNVF